MNLVKLRKVHEEYLKKNHTYKMLYYKDFDYKILSNIMYYKKPGRFTEGTYNDIILMADTETSKPHDYKLYDEFMNPEPMPNHICAWTISIRAYHMNIVTLYGNKPSEFIEALKLIRNILKGDDIYIYFHNLAYDITFLRRFLMQAFGEPKKQLNTKPHYPIYIKYANGIIIRDSLILAGCKLEKWAKDLNVEHQKAVGSWDYDKVRDQNCTFTDEELHYIENDTLAGAECIDALLVALNKNINSIPYTATGIPRGEVRERGEKNRAHEKFKANALNWEQFNKFVKLYHGGYSHANRYFIGDMLDQEDIIGADFTSSYPFCMLAYKYPGKFIPFKDVDYKYILRNSEEYAFIFKFSFINIRLKDNLEPMPALQSTKILNSINMAVDNGRVLSAGFGFLYICEQDLYVIEQQYTWDDCKCTEIEISKKNYLPRWFTDYIFELFKAKCVIKNQKPFDPVQYSLAKSKLNSLYGLTVQKAVRQEVIEVLEDGEYQVNAEGDTVFMQSGEYRIDFEKDLEKEYNKYLERRGSILNYQVGSYVTAFAFRNLFELGRCVKRYYGSDGKLSYPPHWYYSDTDSCYSDDWDYGKIWQYNENCKKLLKANGYGCVSIGEKEYWLGIAELDRESVYTEFKILGSKRYAGRSKEDNEIHITVAGVPKKGAICLDNDLDNFRKDFIFDGTITGKLAHFYIFHDIYIDEYGNEIADSIDLKPCNYHLDAVDKWDFIEEEEVYQLTADEEEHYEREF